jgi:1D-myo-inositol 3-kinase
MTERGGERPGGLVTDGSREPLLLVGPVTVDYIGGQRMTGGGVTYGAAVAAAFGIRARILTIAGPDADLTPLEGHDVEVVRDEHTVTFVFEPSEQGRVMRVPEQPTRPLSADDLPAAWRTPSTLMVTPLVSGDVDTASFVPIAEQAERVGVITQGLQRQLRDTVVELTAPVDISLVRTCSDSYTFFRSRREAAQWSDELTGSALERGARLVTTLGAEGAELRRGEERVLVPAAPSGPEVDATGAGDVFATALILALDEGEQAAAQIAAAFAAASVERLGPAPLPSLSEIRRRIAGMPASAAQRGASG